MRKIKVAKEVAELDGDEMTRVWEFQQPILGYLETNQGSADCPFPRRQDQLLRFGNGVPR